MIDALIDFILFGIYIYIAVYTCLDTIIEYRSFVCLEFFEIDSYSRSECTIEVFTIARFSWGTGIGEVYPAHWFAMFI